MLYTNLQDSPARRSPEYLRNIGEWNYLWDVFAGIRAWSELRDGILHPSRKAETYLPKHPEEQDYPHRFRLTEFDRVFAAALTEYVDLLFANGIDFDNEPDWLRRDWPSLSDRSASGQNLLAEVCLNSLIFGISHIFVDYDGDRPRWIPIDPRKIIDWKTEKSKGVESLFSVKIETYADGIFTVTEYFRGGMWTRFNYIKTDDGWSFGVEQKGQIKALGQRLEEIPLVPVPISYHRESYMVGDRQFRTLADKNISLYQITSDYRRKMQLCNTPVPTIYNPRGQGGDVVISPTHLLNFETPDSFFRWEETDTGSLAASRQEMIDLRDDIATDSSRFLKNPVSRVSAGAAKDATAPVQSTLVSFSNLLISATMNAIAIHGRYLGQVVPEDFAIELVPSLKKNQLKDSQFAFSVQAMVKQKTITRHSAIKLLSDAGYLPDDIADTELNLPEELV